MFCLWKLLRTLTPAEIAGMLCKLRAWRVAKRLPSVFWRELWAPLWNREQLLALILACTTTALVLRSNDATAISDQSAAWTLSVTSLLWGLPIWAALMAVRAPFVVLAEERGKGAWYGGRFIYHQPELVATFRCKATGQPRHHAFRFHDAEPDAFVYFTIEVDGDPSPKMFAANVVSDLVLVPHMTVPGSGAGRGGLRIGRRKEASLLIAMDQAMISQTVRVYMRDFSLLNPDDKDGTEGEFLRDYQQRDLSQG
jgi:hypothetical protein